MVVLWARTRKNKGKNAPSNTTKNMAWKNPRDFPWSQPCRLVPAVTPPADTPHVRSANRRLRARRWGRALIGRRHGHQGRGERRRTRRRGTLQAGNRKLSAAVDDGGPVQTRALRFAEKREGADPFLRAQGAFKRLPPPLRGTEAALRGAAKHPAPMGKRKDNEGGNCACCLRPGSSLAARGA